jgi:protocatechuate 3,4-dioxygenase beta subunit
MVDDNPQTDASGSPSRRSVLTGLGAGVGLVTAGLGAAAAEAAIAPEHAVQPVGKPSACTLSPEQMEGPFYLDGKFIRRDMTEGKAGVPLALCVKVVDSAGCKPIKDVAVDLWQCDAEGAYSAFAEGGSEPGTTFLRGIQLTDAQGLATFKTVYPGWYVGRAIHIHIKTLVGGKVAGKDYVGGHVAHTGQLYFTEDFNGRVAKVEPYVSSKKERTLNAEDGIFANGGAAGLITTSGQVSKGLAGHIQVSIDPKATPDPA